jgi:hypothetical protein
MFALKRKSGHAECSPGCSDFGDADAHSAGDAARLHPRCSYFLRCDPVRCA